MENEPCLVEFFTVFLKKHREFLHARNTIFAIPLKNEYSHISNGIEQQIRENGIEKLQHIFNILIELLQCAIDKPIQEQRKLKIAIESRTIIEKNVALRRILASIFSLDTYIVNNEIKPLPYIIPSNKVAEDIDCYLSKIDFTNQAANFRRTNKLQIILSGSIFSDSLNNHNINASVIDQDINNEIIFTPKNDFYFSDLVHFCSLHFNEGDNLVLSNFIEKINVIIEDHDDIGIPFSFTHCNELLKIIWQFKFEAFKEKKRIHYAISQIERKIIQSNRTNEVTLKDIEMMFNWHLQRTEHIEQGWCELVTKIPFIAQLNIENLHSGFIEFPNNIKFIRDNFDQWKENQSSLLPLSIEQRDTILAHLKNHIIAITKNGLLYDFNLSEVNQLWVGLAKKLSEEKNEAILSWFYPDLADTMKAAEVIQVDKIAPKDRVIIKFDLGCIIADIKALKQFQLLASSKNITFDDELNPVTNRHLNAILSNHATKNLLFTCIDNLAQKESKLKIQKPAFSFFALIKNSETLPIINLISVNTPGIEVGNRPASPPLR